MDKKPTKQPLGKFLAWCIYGFVPLALVFAAGIALMSKTNFLIAFGWIMVFVAIIVLPMTLWFYVIEPLWLARASDKLRDNTKKVAGISLAFIVLASLILAPAGIAGGDTWSGNGQVDLFPEGSVSKNYLVTADIKVTTKWWWQRDYEIDTVTWPDGETDNISTCIVHGSNPSKCFDSINGETYTVTVVQEPDQPPRDNS